MPRGRRRVSAFSVESKSPPHSIPPWLAPNNAVMEVCSSSDASSEAQGGEEVLPMMSTGKKVVKYGDVMEEVEGVGVEFWDVEKLSLLCPNTPVLLCGMLNSGSGVVWAGVGKDGRVKGCKMGRGERDKVRQMLDKVCSTNISPRVGPRVVDIEFVQVAGGESDEQWLVRYMVRLNQEVMYRVRNLTNRRFREGVYVRKDTGPEYTEFVPEDVLKSIQDL